MKDFCFSGTKILVVGGAGFIGSNLVSALVQSSADKIIIIDNLLSSDVSNIHEDSRVHFIFGSITDNLILSQIPSDIDYVFHLACYHGNQSSIAHPFADHENSAYASLKLFDYLRYIRGIKRIVYASAACAVAKKTFDTPVVTTEDQPLDLYHDSPYSISKIIGELYGNYYFKTYNLPLIKARFSNVYGPREILGAGRWRGTTHTIWRNVTPTFIWRSINRESLPLDNSGNLSRDFIYVDDLVRGLMACALKGTNGEVYNLATGKQTSIKELALLINQLTGNTAPLDFRQARNWDRSGMRFASPVKAAEELGFSAQVNISDGLLTTIRWTENNLDLIRKAIASHSKLDSQTVG